MLKYLGKGILIGTIAIISIVIMDLRKLDQARCDYIEELAGRPEVINYLNKWASEYLINKGYYFISGMGYIAAHRNEDEEIYYIPLPDKKVTGIEDRYFRFSIEKHESDFHDPIVSSNMHSMYIGKGRDHVIITKNGHTLTSYRGHDIKSRKLKIIGPSVYAYCSSGRFRM